MKFIESPLSGAFVVEIEPVADPRGMFARTFCAREFEAQGLCSRIAQCNVSYNRHAGTVRGMHFQRPPMAENKLVRCTRGAIHDVIVDLRPEQPTYLKQFGIELSAENRRGLFVPHGIAHGFQTLADDTEVFYLISEFYAPEHASGVRHDDPAVDVRWPRPISEISDKDRAWPLLAA